MGGRGECCADNPRGYRQSTITHDHDDGRDGLTQIGGGGDIAVSYGGEGHDSPVHSPGDAIEARLFALYEVHERTQDEDNIHDEKEK